MPRRSYKVAFKPHTPCGSLVLVREGVGAERRLITEPKLAFEYVIVSAGKTLKPYLLGKTLKEAQRWIYKMKGTLRRHFRKPSL